MALPPVYTEGIIRIPFVTAGSFSYTVPDGLRAIIVDITGFLGSEGNSESVLQVTSGVGIYWQWFSPPVRARQFHWQGRQSFDAGEVLDVTLSSPAGANAAIEFTAYMLTLP